MTSLDRSPLIFPLDVDSVESAGGWVRRLAAEVRIFKVGLELFSAVGPAAIDGALRAGAGDVFLDAKLHDIPATVEGAARSARDHRVRMLTAHCQGGRAMLEAAVRGAGDAVRVLGVTRLTSLPAGVDEVVEAALLAKSAGCGGVVCSGHEAEAVRKAIGDEMLIVCPGVRPAGSDAGDQVRVMTPRMAMRAGAD